jgi:hypothetical protein
VTGGSGDDTITGGGGNDSMTGGAGNDTYIFLADADATDDIIEAASGGTDTISTTGAGANVDITALDFNGTTGASLAQIEQIVIDTGRQFEVVGAQVTGLTLNINEVATGTATLDIDIAASGGNVDISNFTFGAAGGTAFDDGADVIDIDGEAGNNVITGSSIQDTIAGAAGTDTIALASGGNDIVEYNAVTEGGAVGAGGTFAAGDSITGMTITGANGVVDDFDFNAIASIALNGGNVTYEAAAATAATGTNTVIEITGATAASLTSTANVLTAIGNISGQAAAFATGDVHIFLIDEAGNANFGVYAYTEADGLATVAQGDLTLLATVVGTAGSFDADNLIA